jgi:hypothetical protein
VDCNQLAPEVHVHTVDSAIHPLNASRVIEEGDGHRIGEQPRSRCCIPWRREARQGRKWAKISQAHITRNAEYCSIEIVAGAVQTIEKGGKLELPKGDAESGVRELCLYHLLEQPIATSD